MKKFEIVFAYDVPCYHTVTIEAADEDAANDMVRAMLADDNAFADASFTPEWGSAGDIRVVDMLTTDDVKWAIEVKP